MTNIGLAMGGGGVRGMVHIPVLELFDELNLKPNIIAGTSIGAIMGALYACGMSGGDIRELIAHHTISNNDTWQDIVDKKDTLLQWLKGITLEKQRGGLISADRFIGHLLEPLESVTFDQLNIPLKVIATDYHKGTEVILDSGPVLSAVKASMSVPGVFRPVSIDDKLLIDGGVVNQVPYDHVMDQSDFTIAIDVGRGLSQDAANQPSSLEVTLRVFQIMQDVILKQKMKTVEPDIYFKPKLSDIYFLDFTQIDDVLKQAESSVADLKQQLLEKTNAAHQGPST